MTPTPATHHAHHFENLPPDQFGRPVQWLIKCLRSLSPVLNRPMVPAPIRQQQRWSEKMKFTRHDLPYESYNTWKEMCPEGTYRRVAPDLLEDFFPHDLLSKTNSVIVMASGSPQASVFVANLNRVDISDHAVDQQPYIVAYSHDDFSASGGFIHHGNWAGRTERPGKRFFDGVSASGIQAFYPLSQMPTSASGYLTDLEVDSQKEAFWNALSLLEESSG